MARGSNKCAACGEFAGRGHTCPTPNQPALTSTPDPATVSPRSGGMPPKLRAEVAERISRAQAAMNSGTLTVDDVGLSQQEQDEITGRAIGQHMWEQIMTPWGGENGYRTSIQSETYDRLRDCGYDVETIQFDEDGDPYVEHKSGAYRARWSGGPYLNVYHVTDPEHEIEALHVGSNSDLNKNLSNQTRLADWVKEDSQYYR